MATKISHKVQEYRPPPYLGNIPKKKQSFLVVPYVMNNNCLLDQIFIQSLFRNSAKMQIIAFFLVTSSLTLVICRKGPRKTLRCSELSEIKSPFEITLFISALTR